MPDLLWISIAIVVIAAVLILRLNRNLLAPLSLAFFFMVLTFMGTVSIALRDPARSRMALYVAAGILFFGLGAVAARRHFRYNPREELAAFRALKVQSMFANYRIVSWAFYSFVALGALVVWLYLVRAGVPLLSAFAAEAKVLAREEGGYFGARVMRIYVPLLLMMYFVGRGSILKRNGLVAFFLATFLLTALTLSGFRGYVLSFLAIPTAIVAGYHKIPGRVLFWVALGGAASLLIVTGVTSRESDIGSILEIVRGRILEDPVTSGLEVVVYNMVPTRGYFYGSTIIMDISAFFSRFGLGPPGIENFAQYGARFYAGSNPFGVQVAMTLIGEAYANLGIYGVLMAMSLYGFLMEWLHIRSVRRPKDILLFPLAAYLQFFLVLAYQGPFLFSMLADLAALLGFAIIFVCLYCFWSLPFGGPRFRKLSLAERSSAPGVPEKSSSDRVTANGRLRHRSAGGVRW